MSEQRSNDYAEPAIDLSQVWRVLWGYRLFLVCTVSTVVLLTTLLSFIVTPRYRSEVLMASVENESQSQLSLLADQFAPVASLAGLDMRGGGTNKFESIATLESRKFMDKFILERNLLPVLFADDWDSDEARWIPKAEPDIPTMADAYRLFDGEIRQVTEDRRTGLLTLSILWKDRFEAAEWASALVARVNQDLRDQAIVEAEQSIKYLNEELGNTSDIGLQQGIFRLIETQINNITLAKVREQFAFRVIDPATVPDADDIYSPNRFIWIVVSAMLSFGLSLVFIAVREYSGAPRSPRRDD